MIFPRVSHLLTTSRGFNTLINTKLFKDPNKHAFCSLFVVSLQTQSKSSLVYYPGPTPTSSFVCDVQFKKRCFHKCTNNYTCIVERVYPIEPPVEGDTRDFTFRDQTYQLVTDTLSTPASKMEVILTEDVEGIGHKAERVLVTKLLARLKLLPSGMAVYASPENIDFYENYLKENPVIGPRHGIYTIKTIRKLSVMNVLIPMNATTEWTLNTMHIYVALRQAGVEVPLDSISLSEENITEAKKFVFDLCVNQISVIKMTGIVYYNYMDWSKAPKKHLEDYRSLPPVWNDVDKTLSLKDLPNVFPNEK